MVYPDSAGFKAHEAEEESIKRSKMELLLREIKEAGLTSSVLGVMSIIALFVINSNQF